MKRLLFVLALALLWTCSAFAQAPIIGALPFTLTNGTVADANQVMANFNFIVSSTNNNAATAGVNNNITSLTGLTTPLSPSQGGTSIYYGGTSTGSGNNYIVGAPTPIGFTLTAGRTIVFVVSATNTGPATLNVSGTGITNFYRQTANGPAAMAGGEMVIGNTAVAYFDGTQYQCTTCNIPSLVPAGVTADYSGVIVPLGWLLANGSAQSRTTFLALFNAIAFTSVSATTTITNPSVVVPNSALFQIGWSVGGNNVTCNSTISAIPDGTHITISANASATGATTLTIGPYPQGDCSTTFNLPNYTGRVTAMADGVTNITATSCTNAGSVGTNCGVQTRTLLAGNIPSLTSSNATQGITVNPLGVSSNSVPYSTSSGVFESFNLQVGSTNSIALTSGTVANANSFSGSNSISTTYTNASPTAVVTLQPTAIVTKIIKY